MPVLPYSGAAMRNAHFSYANDVAPGVNPDHTHPSPEPDPFNPQPDVPPDQTGTVWAPDEPTAQHGQPSLAAEPVTHWFAGQPAVPSGEPYGRAQLAMQARMFVDHMQTNYVPDSIRLYQHISEGQTNEFLVGRLPFVAGESLPEASQYLANGRNGYDQTNQPNEVYTGDAANVGHYRLGVKTNMFGLYESPLGKFGQDALLHAYSGLTPSFPAQKNQLNESAAPYTPNSSGATAYWDPASSWQAPSQFTVPSETAITDYSTATDSFSSDDFDNRGRL